MTTSYIACSCNSVPHCADWGNNGLVCFGTCNAIAIYEPCTYIGHVTHTLHRHHDHVKTVHWIKPGTGKSESEFLSGSADGTAIIWRKSSSDNTFQDTAVLNVGNNVEFADSLQLSDVPLTTLVFPKLLICTGSINGEVKVWLREEDGSIKTIQTILFDSKFPIYGRLTYLSDIKCPLLAVALEDASILLYVKDSDAPESYFVKVHSLIGHQDWVRCMEFAHYDKSIFLATGSQDKKIRLWKINKAVEQLSTDEFQQKRNFFTVNDTEYDVTLESIFHGHEDWIYGIHWEPIKAKDDKNCQKIRLLSSSMDKSMIIWELDDSTGVWIDKVRVGKVGGNTLGFFGCKFSPDGLHILGHCYQGSFQIWKYSQKIDNWIARSAPGGHFSEVLDLCWDPKGRFFITASKDQTTKIHAPWKDDSKELWHEIARPQVHGYDMACLVMLTPYIYASGAEEKVVRIFSATSAFRDRLKLLADTKDFKIIMPDSATVPSLGLMNKATFNEKVDQSESEKENLNNTMYEPPIEEELTQCTLWPELKKLYGHGYEIFCMAVKHDRKLLATACRSNTQQYSGIILWNTDTWCKVQELNFHKLTITQIAFSPNDKYLLAVSRDRRWSLYNEINDNYTLISSCSKTNNPHSRIIWSCSWTHDSNYFATGSRDGKIAVWCIKDINCQDMTTKTMLMQNESVTALCFVPRYVAQQSYIIAIGYDTGCIELQMITMNMNNSWLKLIKYDTFQAHHLTVKRLAFRPIEEHSSNTLQLASCGSDYAVKIYDIDLSSFPIEI